MAAGGIKSDTVSFAYGPARPIHQGVSFQAPAGKPRAPGDGSHGEACGRQQPEVGGRERRRQLGELGVRVIRLGTIFEKMSFDKETIVVQAGKPVEFLLDNSDLMPHNFVIVTPGNLEKIGNAAEAFATEPGAAAKQYVPDMPAGVVLLRLFPTISRLRRWRRM